MVKNASVEITRGIIPYSTNSGVTPTSLFDRLVGGGDIGFGDDFHERSAAAVEVHAGMGGVVVDLGGILLEVDVVDADELLRSVRADDLHASADAKRISVFRDLVVLRHVGVEVVLAVERGVTVDLASEHETAHDRKLHGFLVHDRKRTRIPEAHRAYVSGTSASD